MNSTIILASESPAAPTLLLDPGISVALEAADLDDAPLAAPMIEIGSTPDDIAPSSLRPRLPKSATATRALLSGQRRQVNSAVTLTRDGKVVWHIEVANFSTDTMVALHLMAAPMCG